MNNLIEPRRLSKMFLKHTVEHYRTYLMSFAVLTGVLLLGGLFLFYVMGAPDKGLQSALYGILMLLAGTLFTSTIFSDYGTKDKAIPALTLPASTLEKYFVGWLYSFPIFLVVYTASYYLMLLALASLRQWGAQGFELFNVFQSELIIVPVLYALLHAISIYGAIYFNRLHFIKTGFAFFIAYAVALLLNNYLLRLLTGVAIYTVIPFTPLNFQTNGTFYSIAASHFTSMIILTAMVGAALFIWVAAYFRLKEKEV